MYWLVHFQNLYDEVLMKDLDRHWGTGIKLMYHQNSGTTQIKSLYPAGYQIKMNRHLWQYVHVHEHVLEDLLFHCCFAKTKKQTNKKLT